MLRRHRGEWLAPSSVSPERELSLPTAPTVFCCLFCVFVFHLACQSRVSRSCSYVWFLSGDMCKCVWVGVCVVGFTSMCIDVALRSCFFPRMRVTVCIPHPKPTSQQRFEFLRQAGFYVPITCYKCSFRGQCLLWG